MHIWLLNELAQITLLEHLAVVGSPESRDRSFHPAHVLLEVFIADFF